MAEIKSVYDLLKMKLSIPDYQRPYKWTRKNVIELLSDIQKAVEDGKKYNQVFKYRIGSVILHKENDDYEIVDGQQRLITLTLINLILDKNCKNSLLETDFTSKISQKNIKDNHQVIYVISTTNMFLKKSYKDN